MSESRNKDYLSYIFRSTIQDLKNYNVAEDQFQKLQAIIKKLLSSENLLRDLYILHHIKEFRNTGKYLIYVLKKLDDNVITFDNLTQNAREDKEFLEKELLNYLTGEGGEEIVGSGKILFDLQGVKEDENYEMEHEVIDVESELIKQEQLLQNSEDEDDEEMLTFKQNYMELIQSEEESENAAFELPGMEDILSGGNVSPELNSGVNEKKEEYPESDLPNPVNKQEPPDPESELPDLEDKSEFFNQKTEEATEKFLSGSNEEFHEPDKESGQEKMREKISDSDLTEESQESMTDNSLKGKSNQLKPEETDENEYHPNKPKDLSYDDSGEYFIIKEIIPKFAGENPGNIDELPEDIDQDENNLSEDHITESNSESLNDKSENVSLNSDIQEELNRYEQELKEKLLDSSVKKSEDFEESEVKEIIEEPTANEEFLNFENEIKSLNGKLNSEFDSLIYIITAKIDNEEERSNIIGNIREISDNLELTSKEMSLEIISNIYQAIRLSFEKISKGKYDITESTVNLFKQGLILVSNLIKGEDYFGYKNILKSIENIRKGLIEENKKREEFIRQRELKKQIATKLDERFPDEIQKEKLIKLKKIIKDTDENFKNLYKIEGEYKIYEALRSLSSNLNNLKESVLIAKDLKLTKMVQISEAGYIFLKFLNSYRINPVTDDIKEIFSYLIFNMKAIIIDKEVEDQDVFISYLNDPVKIFNKIKKT